MPTEADAPQPQPSRLTRHLAGWLGRWPPAQPFDVVGSARRREPGWDGEVHPVLGVHAPGGGVLCVAPQHVAAVRDLRAAGSPDRFAAQIPGIVGYPGWRWYEGVFRFTLAPAPLPDAGIWVPAADPEAPAWLYPFGGDVLVALDPDTGQHLAGVGLKRHNSFGWELAVVTTREARGRGLARRLVAQAARRVLDEGAVPTYAHAVDNVASAHVAAAAGFPDLGWSAMGISEPSG